MLENLKTLQSWIEDSCRIVFFGGAGVSTESGIPDFRSTDGLYHQQYDYPPETILSHSFFLENTEEFYRFYRQKMIYPSAKPNKAHHILAKLEHMGKLTSIITQNIDGLHQQAGSHHVLELHGSILRNYCMTCHAPYPLSVITESTGIPHCSCGGIIKPDVVLYEEALNTQVLQQAQQAISQADLLLIGGTSLSVYPAAGLIHSYNGSRLVLINRTPTPYDQQANLIFSDSIGHVLSSLKIK